MQIIGDGNDRLIKETRAKISNYNLDDKLILLGKRDNPYPYMKASNLYVCTSFSEAYPCVINEAKALGLPVVSNDFPSSREVLNDEFGVITSYEKLPEAICDMIKDKDGCYSCLGKCQWHANNLHIMEMIDSVILS